MRHRPFLHGIDVTPSGRLPSSRASPRGSRRLGVSAEVSAALTIMLMAVCLAPRPADFRQLRPCTPLESIAAPQIQSCGVHSGATRRRDTAMRIDVLSRRVPTEDIGMACRNAPEDGAAAAIRRARLSLGSRQHRFSGDNLQRTTACFLIGSYLRIWCW